MSFESLVEGICQQFHKEAMDSYQHQWLERQQVKIRQEIDGFNYHFNLNFSYTITHTEVTNRYLLNYSKQVKPRLETAWQEKIKSNKQYFIDRLEHFFKRHTWLLVYKDSETKNSITYLFIAKIIAKIIKDSLQSSPMNKAFTLGFNLDVDCLSTRYCYIIWPVHNELAIEAYLNDYPFRQDLSSDVNWKKFQKLPFNTRSVTTINQKKNYLFSRLDVYQLLFSYFDISLAQYTERGINRGHQNAQWVGKVMPVELDELEVLDEISKKYCKHWLINIETLTEPFWLFLEKYQGLNILYVPKELLDSPAWQKKLNQIKVTMPIDGLTIIENQCSNQYAEIEPSRVWQYHLFARVLPYCLQSNRQVLLENYRSHVSLYHLVSYVWQAMNSTSCVNDNTYGDKSVFQVASPFHGRSWYQLLRTKVLDEHKDKKINKLLYADKLLAATDSHNIHFKPSEYNANEIILQAKVKENYFLQACFMACFQKTSHIELTLSDESKKDMPDIPMYIFDKLTERLDYVRFYQRSSTEQVNPGHFPPLVRLSNASAVNRLIQNVYQQSIDGLLIDDRWFEAGKLIFALFKNQPNNELPINIQHYLQQIKVWQQDQFHPKHAPNKISYEWQMAQFSQMGRMGLDVLFDYLRSDYLDHWQPILELPVLNRPILFDLNGDRLLSSAQYIEHLNDQLLAFLRDERCTQKFSQIHFILPNKLTRDAVNEFSKLLQGISDSNYEHSKAIVPIYLYDFLSLSTLDQNSLLKALEQLANLESKPLITQLKVTELDEKVSDNQNANFIKTRYRALQNKILDNQRCARQPLLADSTLIFNQAVAGTLDPMIDIRSSQHRQLQPFEGKDQTLLLSSQAPGIQQELQQNVEARHEVVQQIEKKQLMFEQTIPEIKAYQSDLSRLITRHNIDKLLKTKESSQCWSNEFSRWVGSGQDADFLINFIEPEALEKIAKFQSYFQMGLEYNQLPFGFYLSFYPDENKSYILCYDDNKAKTDRHEWQLKTKERRNPFILHLDEKSKAVNFEGDFRQFTLLGVDESVQVAFWFHLATQSMSDAQQQKQARCLGNAFKKHINPNHPYVATQMMRYELSQRIEAPWTLANIKNHLASWAQTKLKDKDDNTLFCQYFIGSMDSAQLKAFGQLCYYFDSQKDNLGSAHFLNICYAMYHTFGQKNFGIWQQFVLAKLDNGQEILAKELLDAMGLSLMALKEKSSIYSQIWFKLLRTQSDRNNYVRYDRLWYAYQAVIAYVDAKQLWLNEAAVTQLIDKQANFQVVPWLDRLYHCLNVMEGQLYEKEAQQSLLDNVSKIDWCKNGLVYAMYYNHLPYWSEDMALTAFAYAKAQKGYEVYWDALKDNAVYDQALPVYFSRYLVAKLRLNFKDHQYYIEQIKPVLTSNKISYSAARLLLIHLSYGIDQLSTLTNQEVDSVIKKLDALDLQAVLTWLNQQFLLDGQCTHAQYQVAFSHLPIVAKVIQSYGFDKLSKLSSDIIKRSLNALGKMCQYLQCQPSIESHEQINLFVELLDRAINSTSYLEAMQQTPWLLMKSPTTAVIWQKSQCQERLQYQQKLLSQLESIDYQNSHWLPSKEDIQVALGLLNNDSFDLSEIDEKRRHCIADWLKNGCDITFQDGAFRPLDEQEQILLTRLLSEQLLAQHINENRTLIKLLVPYFMIETNSKQVRKTIFDFVFQLKRIDNKPHFNDLSAVLGNILSILNQSILEKISLPHLTEVLECLMTDEHDENSHFQNELLSQVIRQSAQLLVSVNPDELSKKMELRFKQRVKQIFNMQIPNQVKPILLNLIYKGCPQEQFEWIVDNYAVYGIVGLQTDFQIELAKALLFIVSAKSVNAEKHIDCLLYGAVSSDNHPLWFKSRSQLIKQLNKERSINVLESLECFLLSNTQKYSALEVIAYNVFKDNIDNLKPLYKLLEALKEEDLNLLATLCAGRHPPTAAYLIQEFSKLTKPSIFNFIHQFKAIDRVKGLRHYSIDLKDGRSLIRLLGNIKVKGKGYINDEKQKEIIGKLFYLNAYAQENSLAKVRCQQLKTQLRQTALWLQQAQSPKSKETYRLQLLAILREVLLRETAMWANHTQMLDLIYASMHNNESLFHQVKTGQGKSIITIIRVAYHALNGKVVDVFTAKEDLSSRDHEEFSNILDAIGIEHNHIVAADDEQSYKVGDELFGAVNYLTPSSFSLYQSGHCWNEHSQRFINFSSQDRVAFFDEGDHVLLDEQTMFNFSYGGETGNLYNYDAWVYQATWRYFQSIKEALPVNENGIFYVSRQTHLAGLCHFLQKQGDLAPVQSKFIQNYFAPVVDDKVKNKAEAIEKRDKILGNLLSAAFVASHLEQHRDFCIQDETLSLADGSKLPSRAAKVVINNQVQGGATYSERAHQFLHVRLNEEALAQGKEPNFFITPDSDIVLSQNVPALIKHYYGQIEGCSGTMGDRGEIAVYQARFDIDHVVKLPTHEISQTQYLGMIFCEGETEHEQAITDCLKAHRQHPTLLVSEDDVAVKALSKRMLDVLPEAISKDYICDTNDSGKTEKNTLAFAGKPGIIVNSARMARGTDIKPETEAGLLVIRANPSIPRLAKQSGGRQGRNGAQGVLIDIINFSKVQKMYQSYEDSNNYCARLTELMCREEIHLQEKLDKHLRNNSAKWDWLRQDPLKREKYIKTRVVEYLNYEIKIQNEQYIRAKEAVVSECSSHVMQLLMNNIGDDQTQSNQIRKDWIACRSQIESAWQQRMKEVKEENDDVFDAFYLKATEAWQQFVMPYSKLLNVNLLNDKAVILHATKSMRQLVWQQQEADQALDISKQQSNMSEVIQFYQFWLAEIANKIMTIDDIPLRKHFYGKSTLGINALDKFYRAMITASQSDSSNHQAIKQTKLLFETLKKLPTQQVTKVPLAAMIFIINTFDRAKNTINYNEKLNCLAQFFNHPCLSQQLIVDIHVMNVAAALAQFISQLSCESFVNRSLDCFRRFSTSDAIDFIADVFSECDWPLIDPALFSTLEDFIIKDETLGKLLVTHLNKKQWQILIKQLMRYDMNVEADKKYIEQTLHYFSKHQALLNNTHHEVLTDLLDIFFYYPHRRFDADIFITPDCLVYANVEENIQFTHFIVEQYMTNQTELKALVAIINEYYKNDDIGAKKMRSKIMPRIKSLAPNIPFQLIKERVENIANDHSLKGFEQSMHALLTVGNSLNVFTQTKGITTLENSLPKEGEDELLLQRSQAIILKKNADNQLTQAWLIFDTLSNRIYESLEANTCLMAVEQFGEDYKTVLNFLLTAKASMTDKTYSLFHQALFSNDEEKLSLNEFKQIAEIFKEHTKRFSYKFENRQQQQHHTLETCLKPWKFGLVAKKLSLLKKHGCDFNDYHIWHNFAYENKTVNEFDEILSFINQTMTLDPSLSSDILSMLDDNYDQQRLLSFVHLAQQDQKSQAPIPTYQLQNILKKWHEKLIVDADHLARVFKAQKSANVLATETAQNVRSRNNQGIVTTESLFGSFTQKNQPGLRFDLMHSISHGLISFCQELQEKFWSFYQNILNDIIGDVGQRVAQLPEDKRATVLGSFLSTIKAWTMELTLIATSVTGKSDCAINRYQQLSRSFESQYTGSWLNFFSINSVRRQQSNDLFININNTISNAYFSSDFDKFYGQMLDVIQNTQQDIFEKDQQNNILNTKGYSRLVDISQQLGLQLCKDIILDPKLMPKTKEKARDWLSQQEKVLIQQLWQRLPSEHTLVEHIQSYAKNPDLAKPSDIYQAKQAICKLELASLPKELNYLLPLLKGHFDTTEAFDAASSMNFQ